MAELTNKTRTAADSRVMSGVPPVSGSAVAEAVAVGLALIVALALEVGLAEAEALVLIALAEAVGLDMALAEAEALEVGLAIILLSILGRLLSYPQLGCRPSPCSSFGQLRGVLIPMRQTPPRKPARRIYASLTPRFSGATTLYTAFFG